MGQVVEVVFGVLCAPVAGLVWKEDASTRHHSSALWTAKARDPLSDRTPTGEAQNDVR